MTKLVTMGAAAALAISVAGCSKSTSAPSTAAAPKFTANLQASNEIPAPADVDAGGSGTASITFNLTKDSGGNITAATADFAVTLSGLPANTTLTGAHIHAAPAGQTAGVLVPVLGSGEVTLPTGSGNFAKNGINIGPADAQAIMNNPAGYYFNVHTSSSPTGAARGQLNRTQ